MLNKFSAGVSSRGSTGFSQSLWHSLRRLCCQSGNCTLKRCSLLQGLQEMAEARGGSTYTFCPLPDVSSYTTSARNESSACHHRGVGYRYASFATRTGIPLLEFCRVDEAVILDSGSDSIKADPCICMEPEEPNEEDLSIVMEARGKVAPCFHKGT